MEEGAGAAAVGWLWVLNGSFYWCCCSALKGSSTGGCADETRWQEGEREALKVVLESKVAEGKIFSCRPATACGVSFGSFWRQIKLLTSRKFLWLLLLKVSLLWLFVVQREWGEIRCCFLTYFVMFLLISLPPFRSPLSFGCESV